MKWKIVRTTRFKKDYKKFKHNIPKLRKLYAVLVDLENTGYVPAKYKPHKLHGNYEGCLECHVEDDFLLIWIDEQTGTIKLVRLGSHSELFDK